MCVKPWAYESAIKTTKHCISSTQSQLDIKIAYYTENMDVRFSTVYTTLIVLAKIFKKPKTCNYQNTSMHTINTKIGSQTQYRILSTMQK